MDKQELAKIPVLNHFLRPLDFAGTMPEPTPEEAELFLEAIHENKILSIGGAAIGRQRAAFVNNLVRDIDSNVGRFKNGEMAGPFVIQDSRRKIHILPGIMIYSQTEPKAS